jgi:protein arginine kinase
MAINDLTKGIGAWLSGEGPLADVVISSRIRLARNLAGYNFLSRASESERRKVYRSLSDCIAESGVGQDCFFIDMEQLGEIDRQLLVERHLISRQHAEAEGSRGVAISQTETRSLMINEEDHLRMQVLRSGLQLEQLWAEINEIDDQIEQAVDYAFDSRFGYLTACPTNIGTGIRVSVMLHLPALKLTQEIEKVLRAAKDMHLAVRGLYGEGTEAIGDFFQLSNQTTLGVNEEELVREFSRNIIPKVVEYECTAREMLAKERTHQLDDKIWRAFGTLQTARTMSSEETLFHLSHVRMGVNMHRFDRTDLPTVNELFLRCQPAHLQKMMGERLDGEHRSIARAEYLRRRLASNN